MEDIRSCGLSCCSCADGWWLRNLEAAAAKLDADIDGGPDDDAGAPLDVFAVVAGASDGGGGGSGAGGGGGGGGGGGPPPIWGGRGGGAAEVTLLGGGGGFAARPWEGGGPGGRALGDLYLSKS